MILANNRLNRKVKESSLNFRQRVWRFSFVKGGGEMNGLDQIIVFMWFLPVVLFLVIPLCVGAVWWPVSLFVKLIRGEVEHERSANLASS